MAELRVSPQGEYFRLLGGPYMASRVPLQEGSRGRCGTCRRMLRGSRRWTAVTGPVGTGRWKRSTSEGVGRPGLFWVLHWSLKKDPGLPTPAEFGPMKPIFYFCFLNRE